MFIELYDTCVNNQPIISQCSKLQYLFKDPNLLEQYLWQFQPKNYITLNAQNLVTSGVFFGGFVFVTKWWKFTKKTTLFMK
jgi:hypothetical protein